MNEQNTEGASGDGVPAALEPEMHREIELAWTDLPDALKAHPGVKRLYRACGVTANPKPGYTWPPKACPCGSVQRDGCEEHGCKWERDPSLVPQALRIPSGVPGDGAQQHE